MLATLFLAWGIMANKQNAVKPALTTQNPKSSLSNIIDNHLNAIEYNKRGRVSAEMITNNSESYH